MGVIWPDYSKPHPTSLLPDTIRGSAIIGALKGCGIEYVITVPDIPTSEGLLRPIANGSDFRHIKVCKEDEGVGICAGLAFCRKRALLLIQNTGLLDSVNALRAIAAENELPICMMVGLLGKEIGRDLTGTRCSSRPPRQSPAIRTSTAICRTACPSSSP